MLVAECQRRAEIVERIIVASTIAM